jgi:lysyl-tRNA synthetase class 2
MEDTNLKKIRLEKLQKLKEVGVNPYPAYYQKTHTIKDALESLGKNIKTAGRIFSFREHGNIAFADIRDETGKMQVFFQKKLIGNETFKKLKLFDIGDFIGVEGEVGKTVAGEISVIPIKVTLLSKSLQPLPNEWFGLKDTETRYRQRYLDILLNPQVRERFNTRSKVVSGVRAYLDSLGFWEVETPTLQPLYGGANAKPFTTHLNALDQEMYLRIADELYLKRLIVGGYEKVYEIAKDFRNEGIDHTHFPEFTMIEWYEAYADYHIMMDRAEGLLKYIAQKICGSTIITVGEKKIDIGKKWPRIEMTKILQEKLGLTVEKETREALFAYAKKQYKDMQLVGEETKGQLIFAIFEHAIPQLLSEPTWIIDYPQEVSPLSKAHRHKEGWVERFEGYIGGKEIFDGWSELNDSQIQRTKWEEDTNAARKDKEEAQHVDEDFLTAMEHGMPPFGGIGVGIDRLTMLFTNTWVIKEVILFPTLKRDTAIKEEVKEIQKEKMTSRTGEEFITTSEIKLTREHAYKLLTTYMLSKNLIKHCLAAEAAMKGIYSHLHKKDFNTREEEVWGITGLLHDIDYEIAQKENKLHKHGILLFEKNPNLLPEVIMYAIKAHNFTMTNVDPKSDLDWAITCVDQLTGLIVSSTLISPDKKIASIDTQFVLKRFHTPSFSKGVDRTVISLCQEKLGIPLDTFITITLISMQQIHKELGL